MTWQYEQNKGSMLYDNGNILATGYSGAWDGTTSGDYRNRSDMQDVQCKGPIPKGYYTISMSYYDGHKGPVVMRLDPDEGNTMFGRAGFLIHGDLSPPKTGQASEGCIILPRMAREIIALNPDKRLEVF